MLPSQSPGGSKFPYYYKGGELYCLHLGGYASNHEGVVKLMKAEEAFILAQRRSMCAWIDFYQTRISAPVIEELVLLIQHVKHRMPKLALVGCSAVDRWRIKHALKKNRALIDLAYRYFSDPEDAKTWLVSEYQ